MEKKYGLNGNCKKYWDKLTAFQGKLAKFSNDPFQKKGLKKGQLLNYVMLY